MICCCSAFDLPTQKAQTTPRACAPGWASPSSEYLHPSRDGCRLGVMCLKIKTKSRSTASRLKPVLLSVSALLIFLRKRLSHRQSRLGCRPNVDDAQRAEPHGCGESAVRTWMSVRRGPTERRRSEGIPTKEEPSQEQAPLVTWGAFPSNSPKAKREAVRPRLLILNYCKASLRCPNPASSSSCRRILSRLTAAPCASGTACHTTKSR